MGPVGNEPLGPVGKPLGPVEDEPLEPDGSVPKGEFPGANGSEPEPVPGDVAAGSDAALERGCHVAWPTPKPANMATMTSIAAARIVRVRRLFGAGGGGGAAEGGANGGGAAGGGADAQVGPG